MTGATAHRVGAAWSLERVVLGEAGASATMRGTALLGPALRAGDLAYREVVELAAPGRPTLAARRAHRVVVSPGSIELHVVGERGGRGGRGGGPLLYWFGRPNSLGATPGYPVSIASSHVHVCGEDTYRGTLAILSPDHVRLTETVRGPRKAYTITTTYRRLIGAGLS